MEPFFENVTVDYQISESGVLKTNMAAAIPIKITKETEENEELERFVSKAKLTISDFQFKNQ